MYINRYSDPKKSRNIPEALKRLEFTREDLADEIAEKLLCDDYDHLSMRGVRIGDVISKMQKKEKRTQEEKDLVEAQFKQCDINAINLEKILNLLHVNKVRMNITKRSFFSTIISVLDLMFVAVITFTI